MEKLIAQLEAIAKKNKDEFAYRVDVDTSRQGLSYRFVATECADGHEFVTGRGPTIDAAVADAAKDIEECCKSWGYKS